MAGLGAEAAALGRPVVVGGYEIDLVCSSLPGDRVPPVMACVPEEVVEAIWELVTDPDRRESLGRRAREFVQSNWDLEVVAAGCSQP